ncbi:MAG: quinol:electron acceptor oxidoreductase subunit ActD [Bacteroidota bacterium]
MNSNKSTLLNFENERDLLQGIDTLLHHKISITEVYAPKLIRELEKKLRIKEIRMGIAILKFGCLGGSAITSLLYYLIQIGPVVNFQNKDLYDLMANLGVVILTFFAATFLFPRHAPKIGLLHPSDRRYLVVVNSDNITANKEINDLLRYSEAMELSTAVKNMMAS